MNSSQACDPSCAPAGADSTSRDDAVARYDAVPAGTDQLTWLAEEAAAIAQAPVALINLVKSTSVRVVATVGTDVTVLEPKDTVCAAVVGQGRRLHIRDASQDELLASNPFVDGRWARVRFCGAHPLISAWDVPVGALAVFDYQARDLDPSQLERLDDLAVRVMETLEAVRANAAQRDQEGLAL